MPCCFVFTLHSSLVTSRCYYMAIPHFIAMLLFSLLASVVFGVLSKNAPRDQLVYGAKVFAAFVGIAIVLGWLMRFVPR
jgi:type III secretory pathway component EscT